MEPNRTIIAKSGKTLTVRLPEQADLGQVLTYINDLIVEDTYIIMSGEPMTEVEEKAYLTSLLKEIGEKQTVAFYVFDGDKLVANGQIKKRVRRLSHIGDFGITVAKEYRQDGVGSQLMTMLLEEAKTIGVNIVTLEVFSNNERACHVYQKMGFTEFGVLPKSVVHRGETINLIQMYKKNDF
jgi:ribosomal protein S18 acetylase RimI-like enzyme